MKKVIWFLWALIIIAFIAVVWVRTHKPAQSAVAPTPPPPPPKTIVRLYFAGANNISADTNSIAFTNIFCCSQARALETQTLDKLSHAPGTWFKNKLPGGVGDGSAQLRPLLDDFLKSQWIFEMREGTSCPEYALAIRLNNTRAQLWETNLQTLLESWTHIKTQPLANSNGIAEGWVLKKDMPPNLFRIVRSGNWLIIGCGQDNTPLADAWAAGQGLPDNETNWLTANVDWPKLAQIFPVFAKLDLPATHVQVIGRGGNLLPRGTFELAQPLAALPNWQIPTNIIHLPLTSFTAIRGFAPWLQQQKWAKWLQLSPEPNQAFIWSLGLSSLQTFIAVPVTNSAKSLAQLEQNLASDTNWQNHLMTPVAFQKGTNFVAVRNFPLVTPEVRALKIPSGSFLFGDVFPNPPFRTGPPSELIRAVNRDGLVAYHWEITSQRLKELSEPMQLVLMFTRYRQLDPNSATGKWLGHIGPTLGNCVTEVKQTGPNELAFKRSATAGLTAIELMAFTEWLESPDFPGCDLSVPSRRFLRKLHSPAKAPKPQNVQRLPQQIKTRPLPSSSANTNSPIHNRP